MDQEAGTKPGVDLRHEHDAGGRGEEDRAGKARVAQTTEQRRPDRVNCRMHGTRHDQPRSARADQQERGEVEQPARDGQFEADGILIEHQRP